MVEEKVDKRRPYAAPANVLSVIRRTRTRNLPDAVDEDFFALVNIPHVVYGRVFEALKFLGLIGKDRKPTEQLQAIASSSDEEYPKLLANVVHEAYAEDFRRVNPSEDTQAQIQSAFKVYSPRSQTNRMVILFLGLCREAGISVKEAPRQRDMTPPLKQRPASPKGQSPTPESRRQESKSNGEIGRIESPPSALFGVTEQDIGLLDDDEFEEVWSALGKVARARSRALQAAKVATAESVDAEDAVED